MVQDSAHPLLHLADWTAKDSRMMKATMVPIGWPKVDNGRSAAAQQPHMSHTCATHVPHMCPSCFVGFLTSAAAQDMRYSLNKNPYPSWRVRSKPHETRAAHVWHMCGTCVVLVRLLCRALQARPCQGKKDKGESQQLEPLTLKILSLSLSP